MGEVNLGVSMGMPVSAPCFTSLRGGNDFGVQCTGNNLLNPEVSEPGSPDPSEPTNKVGFRRKLLEAARP